MCHIIKLHTHRVVTQKLENHFITEVLPQE